MKVHELKILPEYFRVVKSGLKTFEVRRNDRDFKFNDTVILKEWDKNRFTGREITKRIGYVLSDHEFCKEGYVIFGIL